MLLFLQLNLGETVIYSSLEGFYVGVILCGVYESIIFGVGFCFVLLVWMLAMSFLRVCRSFPLIGYVIGGVVTSLRWMLSGASSSLIVTALLKEGQLSNCQE